MSGGSNFSIFSKTALNPSDNVFVVGWCECITYGKKKTTILNFWNNGMICSKQFPIMIINSGCFVGESCDEYIRMPRLFEIG